MTICTPALPTKKIPLCILTLIIGKISSANANVNIFIVDITTGRRFILQSTSDGAGLVSVDLTAIEFSEEHTYELWITLQSANPEDKEDITIDTETATTVALGFLSLFTEGGDCFPADGTLETA
jgi:hypothetical protein